MLKQLILPILATRFFLAAAFFLAATFFASEVPASGGASDEVEKGDTTMSPCMYVLRQSGDQPSSLADVPHCFKRTEQGEIQLSPRHLEAMEFNEDGLAVFATKGTFYYFKPDGSHRMALTYDNWADDFADGLARTLIDEKVAYFDKSLRVVVPPAYDWGWPFAEGTALVCRGCQLDGKPGDEHRSLIGGEWGYIDTAGEEVVPIRYTREEARAHRESLSLL